MTLNHPILQQSFAVIDQEIGHHSFTPEEYAIARRVIHATADFDFKQLLRFSPTAIESAMDAIARRVPIITDVTMVKQGIATLVAKTFGNPLICAVDYATQPAPGKTRTETGLLRCGVDYPDGVYVIGNAPTALLGLCDAIAQQTIHPALVVAAPVGFISVMESKQAIAELAVPQIRIEGRKGGSPAAAAIVNALLVLAWERSHASHLHSSEDMYAR